MNSYKIAFLNSKGGVGKSTLCILSALGLSQTRFNGKIKLIDTDSQKSSVSILNDINSKIELDYIPFNHASPNLGVSLLDQKLKAFTREEEIILIDTMAHPPRQLVNCIMQCNAILIPCNLSEIEIRATIEFTIFLPSISCPFDLRTSTSAIEAKSVGTTYKLSFETFTRFAFLVIMP